MVKRVTLDAMIPREDFGINHEGFELELLRDFPISNLSSDSPILKLLRKPDFQRETNHWTPEQIATFIASFLDNEVIPSLILWKSPSYIFVIDGGHRLSALRAWIEDDYGDGPLSISFYRGEISEDQKKIAKRTRTLIEQKIGRYSTLKGLIDPKNQSDPTMQRRANRLFTRPLNLQWIQGNSDVAETSFFKINSQGTPLDETEEMLIKNRRKPIAISARATLRSGTGHKYWSSFGEDQKRKIEELAEEHYRLLFEPESSLPIKTLDVPYGGTVSPIDALSFLVDYLSISSNRQTHALSIDEHPDDEDGTLSVLTLRRSLEVLSRITGNSPGSLGLHPAVYFYNERGKYNRFLFLAVTSLIATAIKNNDPTFFKKFTERRSEIEKFLIDNKLLLGLILQNLSKRQRVPRMIVLFQFMIRSSETELTIENAISAIGLEGRILDIDSKRPSTSFTDDTKSKLFITQAITAALKCPICNGYLLPTKSISYDHKIRVRDGGIGDLTNGQLVHPFCNTGYKA